MKKYFSMIFAFALAFALMFSFAGCSGTYTRKGVPVDTDTRDYAVISNGGSAVQYGKYVYFINGYRGYEDENGKQNTMGKVIKGGLYRTTLADFRQTAGQSQREYNFNYGNVDLNVFVPSYDTESHLQFEYTKIENGVVVAYEVDKDGEFVYNDDGEKIPLHYEDVYNVNADLIVPKTIGTSGYGDGGIFIYDDYIFFASPNNNKNRSNEVQYNKTDFFVTNLSGSQTRKLYTTSNETSSKPYAFYKYEGNYYLVVQDGTDIVSVCMNGNGKIQKAKTIAQNTESVLFPTKDTYYNFSRTVGGVTTTYSSFEYSADDFIYYTRAATKNDNITVGQVMEMVRPNGEQGLILSNDGGSIKLLNTDNGLMFYEVGSVSTGKSIKYSNFHNLLMLKNDNYKNAHQDSKVNFVDISGSFAIDTSSYTSVRCVYPNPKSINDVYVLTFGSASVNIYSATGARTVFEGAATFVKTVQDKLYLVSNSALQYVNLYEGGKATVLVGDASASTWAYAYDILDEYIVFTGDEDTYLKNCAKFKRIDDEGFESLFIGERTEDEEIPEE